MQYYITSASKILIIINGPVIVPLPFSTEALELLCAIVQLLHQRLVFHIVRHRHMLLQQDNTLSRFLNETRCEIVLLFGTNDLISRDVLRVVSLVMHARCRDTKSSAADLCHLNHQRSFFPPLYFETSSDSGCCLHSQQCWNKAYCNPSNSFVYFHGHSKEEKAD